MSVSIYIKHRSGATHFLSGRKAAKLYKEISAGRGGAECTALVESGYEGFLSKDGDVLDFEALTPSHFDGRSAAKNPPKAPSDKHAWFALDYEDDHWVIQDWGFYPDEDTAMEWLADKCESDDQITQFEYLPEDLDLDDRKHWESLATMKTWKQRKKEKWFTSDDRNFQ